MCATAECGPVGLWSHNSEEKSANAKHLKSISGQVERLLEVYGCVL